MTGKKCRKNGGIVSSGFFIEKGDIQECRNYKGIKFLSHTMKSWQRIIEKRITTTGGKHFEFMPKRSTTDAIFAL